MPYLVEYTLDESLPEGEEVIDRQGAKGLRRSAAGILDKDGMFCNTQPVGSAVIQPAVKQLIRSRNATTAALYGENKIAADMQPATGTLLWPVPDYKYVRAGGWAFPTRGADLCADYGARSAPWTTPPLWWRDTTL